jgi:hypothetical protein
LPKTRLRGNKEPSGNRSASVGTYSICTNQLRCPSEPWVNAMQPGILHFITGRLAAGKTTLARKIVDPAFCPLHPVNNGFPSNPSILPRQKSNRMTIQGLSPHIKPCKTVENWYCVPLPTSFVPS